MKKITYLFLMSTLTITYSQAQVSLVKEFLPNAQGGLVDALSNRTVINNELIFTAQSFISNTFRVGSVWKSDGTTNGTVLLHELNIDFQGGRASDFYYSNNFGKVIFLGNNGANDTYGVLMTDGTQSGLESLSGTDYQDVIANTGLPNFFDYSNQVVFNHYFPSLNAGAELNITDGTEQGTGLLKDIFAGATLWSRPENFFEFNNLLFFTADTANTNDRELWISDGTTNGTNLLLDIYPGSSGGSFPDDFTIFNNKLYFSANDGINGRELWITDGTVSGTQRLNDINPIAGDLVNPQNVIVFNNALYFTANLASLGTELFKMNTNSAITSLKNIAPSSASSNPSNLFVSNGRLYFSADDGANGIELWSSTGFSSTTNMLKNINTDAATPDSNPSGFTEYFGELYFAANDGVNGRELWKTDGTNVGTVLVDNINPSGDSNPSNLIVANNRLFFSATNGSTGFELFKYQDSTLDTEEFNELDFSLYPNPITNNFTIKSNAIINTVTIVDIQGKLVKTFSNQLDSYNISDLNSGLYFVNIKSKKGEVTKKLIKE